MHGKRNIKCYNLSMYIFRNSIRTHIDNYYGYLKDTLYTTVQLCFLAHFYELSMLRPVNFFNVL